MKYGFGLVKPDPCFIVYYPGNKLSFDASAPEKLMQGGKSAQNKR